MRIGILGSGLMGGKLGTLFARAGHDVTFSYARSVRKLERLAKDAGAKARAGSPAEAARDADVILLAVPWSRVDEVLAEAGDLGGKIVVTCSLPMTDDDSGLALGRITSGAEALAAKIPDARIVSAFSTVPSEALFGVFERKDKAPRPTLVHCGDHAEAKRKVAALISELGFDPLDVGDLPCARTIEPFSLLVGRVAYELEGGPAVTYRLQKA